MGKELSLAPPQEQGAEKNGALELSSTSLD
jgi:hypothetical protein